MSNQLPVIVLIGLVLMTDAILSSQQAQSRILPINVGECLERPVACFNRVIRP